MITRENYEIYFMEYMDGNLSAREQAEVEAFLLVHPDLRELLDGMDECGWKFAEVFGKRRDKTNGTGKELNIMPLLPRGYHG
ncbi:MAG: hypothetical protein ACLU4N_09485 [Butyricimonas faecihominis]